MRLWGLFIILSSVATAQDHGASTPKQTGTAHLKTGTSASSPLEDFKAEYQNAKKDEGGCLWREEDWERAGKDNSYKALMNRICEAETMAMEIANKDRKKHCKNSLILDQRLAYVSRLNAIRVIKEGGVRHSNPHNGWYKGLPQKWLKDFFPATSKVMRFERENMWGMGGDGADQINAASLASQAATSWIKSPGHHAPMIDCENRYAGVGFMYDPKRNEWLGFMSFGEPIGR